MARIQYQGGAEIRIFSALSYSQTLLGYLADNTRTWHIYSTHRHACNLSTAQGALFSLVSPQHGNGPFHLVLPQAALTQISQADPITVTRAHLSTPTLRISLAGAPIWSPQLPSLQQCMAMLDLIDRLQPYHHQLTRLLGEASVAHWGLLKRLDRGGNQITAGLRSGNSGLVTKSVEELVGLGPGLTPLGDDFLIGILGGLHLATPPCFSEEMRVAFQQGMMKRQTTRLSSLWLQHALGGEFGETWHQLAAALATGSASMTHLALERMAASGATSGLAALSGLCHCWQHLLHD